MNLTIFKNQVLIFAILFFCSERLSAQGHFPLHLKELQIKKIQYHISGTRDDTPARQKPMADGPQIQYQVPGARYFPPNFEPELVSAGLPSPYSMIPVSQSKKLNFAGEVINNGSDTIPNIGVYVDINAGLFNDTIWLTNLSGFSSIVFNSTKAFTPLSTGTYDVDFRIESDSVDADTTNNQLTFQFEVSDSVYAWDNNIVNGSTGPGAPLSGFTNIIYGQLYKVTNEDTLTSISFKLWNGTSGQKVTAAVYFTDGNKLPAAEVPLSTTDTLEISSTAQTWYTLPIQGKPIILPPGTYLVGVKEVNGSTPIGMAISTTDFVPNSSYIFAEGFGWSKSENFWVGDFIYLIRANFGVSFPLLSTSICSVDASCGSCCDGEATVMASGGVLPYSYQWNDTLLQITPTATGLCPGDYMVIVTDSIGNIDTAYVTINGPVGINESITDNSIKLYPDPTSGIINIEFNAEEIRAASISVYNIIGTKVYEITPGSSAKKNHYTIELSNQPDGAYFVQIQTADRVITKKIILNR